MRRIGPAAHTIVSDCTIGYNLPDMLSDQNALATSALIKYASRLFSFVARVRDGGAVAALNLSKGARVICLCRDANFSLTEVDTVIEPGDEVVILTHSKHLTELRERWAANANA